MIESRIARGGGSATQAHGAMDLRLHGFAGHPPIAIFYEVMSQLKRQIIVYTTEPCSFCARVKGLLKARDLEFSEVNLSKDPAGRMELVSRTGMMTFPQVLVGEQLLGGFSETLTAVESGRLDELLAA
jgi:glutaredoxin 3